MLVVVVFIQVVEEGALIYTFRIVKGATIKAVQLSGC